MPAWSGHLTDWFLWDRPPHPHIAATGQALAGRGRRRLAGLLPVEAEATQPSSFDQRAALLAFDIVMVLAIDQVIFCL